MPKSRIYLLIEFSWPASFQPEHAKRARSLHDMVVASDWIEEIVAATGGLFGTPSSIWIFRLENYAALDKLKQSDDLVSKAYNEFFEEMISISEKIREEVIFL